MKNAIIYNRRDHHNQFSRPAMRHFQTDVHNSITTLRVPFSPSFFFFSFLIFLSSEKTQEMCDYKEVIVRITLFLYVVG